MYYSITVKYPKSKIKQYTEPLPQNVSELSDADFISILDQYPDHTALVNNFNKIKHNGQPIQWSPSPQQISILWNYYFGQTYKLADEQQTPDRNFANIIEGSNIIHYYNNNNQRNKIIEDYQRLGIQNNNRFVCKIFGKNIEYTEPYNKEYISQIATPEDFEQILREIYQTRTSPLSRDAFEKMLSSYQVSNGTLYKLPQKIDDRLKIAYNEVFKKVSQEFFPTIITQPLNAEAFLAFLEKFTLATNNEYDYQRLKCEFGYNENRKQIYYFRYEEVNYLIPDIDLFKKTAPEELKTIWVKKTKERRPSTNSIANLVFRDIKSDNSIQWQDDYYFDTEDDKNDEFKQFCKDQYQKFENDQIKTLINAIQIRNPNDTSAINKIKIEGELGNESYSFNLSNSFFNMNSDFQKQWIQSLETDDNTKNYEFKLYRVNGEWWCEIHIVNTNHNIITKLKLFRRGFNVDAYSLDAVLFKNGKLFCIIEFDGSDHFGPRKIATIEGEAEVQDNSILNRICADQLKSAFARSKGVKILRIPDYHGINKTLAWQHKFKQFILEQLGVIQQTPENVNPGVYTKAAYTIRRMIK